MNNNKVLLLADSIELVKDIDVDRALNSKERAEEILARRNTDKDIDVQRAELALAHSMNRIKLKEKINQ